MRDDVWVVNFYGKGIRSIPNADKFISVFKGYLYADDTRGSDYCYRQRHYKELANKEFRWYRYTNDANSKASYNEAIGDSFAVYCSGKAAWQYFDKLVLKNKHLFTESKLQDYKHNSPKEYARIKQLLPELFI